MIALLALVLAAAPLEVRVLERSLPETAAILNHLWAATVSVSQSRPVAYISPSSKRTSA